MSILNTNFLSLVFVAILLLEKNKHFIDSCQIEIENCSCSSFSEIYMFCLGEEFSRQLMLDFRKLQIEAYKSHPIFLKIQNKLLNEIKTSSQNALLKMIISLAIENCVLKELKTNSFYDISSVSHLSLKNNSIELIQQDSFAGLGLTLRQLELDSNKLRALNQR